MPAIVTPTKKTTVTTSSILAPPLPAEMPKINAEITAQIAPNIHVLGPSATTQ